MNKSVYKDVFVNILQEISWKPTLQDDEDVCTKIKENWFAVRELNDSRKNLITPNTMSLFAKYFLKRFKDENSKQANFRP